MRRLKRTVAAGAAATVFALVASGCSQGVYSMPLPGGADVGDNPNTYEIQFPDVLDLVPQSAVKVDGVTVGRVDKIEIAPDGWSAQVQIRVKNRVSLSNAAKLQVQQTSLLGEKFIAIDDPKDNASKPRQPQDSPIPKSRATAATDIEQLLGALSLLLNQGGLTQLKPIIDELNKALGGRESEAKSLINQTATLINGLNKQKDDIVKALDGLESLSATTAQQTDKINAILNELPAGIEVLEEQRPQLVTMLQKADQLGQVGTEVLSKARDEMIVDLKALGPILKQLAVAGPDIITSTPLVLTYPFPDHILDGVKGSAANTFLTVDLRLLNQLEALGVGQGNPKYSQVPEGTRVPKVDPRNPYINGNGPRLGWPTITVLPLMNSRPGPNTPPSGGSYMRDPAKPGQKATDLPLSFIRESAKNGQEPGR